MDSLEGNFPHLFPKPAPLQKVTPAAPGPFDPVWPPAPYKIHGDRGLASNEVLNPGNQTQCNQEYLDGLLFELKQIEYAVILHPGSFEVPGHEPVLDQKLESFAIDAMENLEKLYEERMRLKNHPELFGDERERCQYLERFNTASTRFDDILNGHTDMEVIKTRFELSADLEVHRVTRGPDPKPVQQPWYTWLQPMVNNQIKEAPNFKDFQTAHPEMVLVGSQVIPHNGILIAERWRARVEEIIVDLAQTKPAMADRIPKRERMLNGSKVQYEGRFAALKFTIAQPNAQKTGHVFAFGPQDNVANLARLVAEYNDDVTRLGPMPFAVYVGSFLRRDVAKKYPHLQPLL